MQFTFWEVPGQKALDLALYVKDQQSDKPYIGEVGFRVVADEVDLSIWQALGTIAAGDIVQEDP